jgi:lipoprotein-anchoring transpeptidase ErfK/SrfK
VTYRRYRSSRGGRPAAALVVLLAGALVAGAVAARAQAPDELESRRVAGAPVAPETPAAERALILRLPGRTVTVSPVALGARAGRVDETVLGRWLAGLARRYDHEPRRSRIVLRGNRPYLTEERSGHELLRAEAATAVAAALAEGVRDVALPVRTRTPPATRPGPVVVIRRASHRLVLYDGTRRVRRFPVAVGLPEYPTPLGRFAILDKQRDPWWYPPDSDWAAGAVPTPPGPGNPLGTRWMGISADAVGIHGTPDAASIGYSASHGCVRMRVADAEWLFERVPVGTPVFIVDS